MGFVTTNLTVAAARIEGKRGEVVQFPHVSPTAERKKGLAEANPLKFW